MDLESEALTEPPHHPAVDEGVQYAGHQQRHERQPAAPDGMWRDHGEEHLRDWDKQKQFIKLYYANRLKPTLGFQYLVIIVFFTHSPVQQEWNVIPQHSDETSPVHEAKMP